MIDWCRENPFLTFFLALSALGTIEYMIKHATKRVPDELEVGDEDE